MRERERGQRERRERERREREHSVSFCEMTFFFGLWLLNEWFDCVPFRNYRYQTIHMHEFYSKNPYCYYASICIQIVSKLSLWFVFCLSSLLLWPYLSTNQHSFTLIFYFKFQSGYMEQSVIYIILSKTVFQSSYINKTIPIKHK